MITRKHFTINELERFSGIKSHTVRMWERRYNLLQPIRTPGNVRLYDLDDVKKILDIALLVTNGFRISGLSVIPASKLEEKTGLLSNDYNKWQRAINVLIINMYTTEPESFEWRLDEFLLTWPIETLVEKIIFPFLKITNLLWIGNKLYEEHLAVTAIRKKLILAIETSNSVNKAGKSVLLFLPDSKQLDLGLLYCNYFLKKKGIHVLYMGNDVTIQNLRSIFEFYPIAYLFTYLSENKSFPISQLLQCITLYMPGAKLIIARYSLQNAVPFVTDNLIQMNYVEALDYLHLSCK